MSEGDRLQSPITDWYMKMFGVIPFRNEDDPSENDYIKAGYDGNNQSKRIISYDLETMGTDEGYENSYHIHHDTQGKTQRRKTFIDNFRKIASTSVGRVLLYRLLIEIRRVDEEGNGKFETKAIEDKTPPNVKMLRYYERSLKICYSSSNNYCLPAIEENTQTDSSDSKGDLIARLRTRNEERFKAPPKIKDTSIIKYSNNPTKKTIIVGRYNDNTKTYDLAANKRSVDVVLFHELCHWYHSLRDLDRFNKYNTSHTNTPATLSTHDIGKQFYKGFDTNEVSEERAKISALSWNNCELVTYEEMLNILGISSSAVGIYLEGDDLCENLYRICVNSPIRFPHSDDEYQEDYRVINAAKNILNENKTPYSVGDIICRTKELKTFL